MIGITVAHYIPIKDFQNLNKMDSSSYTMKIYKVLVNEENRGKSKNYPSTAMVPNIYDLAAWRWERGTSLYKWWGRVHACAPQPTTHTSSTCVSVCVPASCSAAWFQTGRRPVVVHGPGVGDFCSTEWA